MSADNTPDDPGRCSAWKAWIDAMPPGRRLHVKGKCVYPTAGWAITLEKAVPQGVNPAVLILNRIAKVPQGPAAQQQTTYEPTYDQKLSEAENYDTVTIMPEKVSVHVEVVH